MKQTQYFQGLSELTELVFISKTLGFKSWKGYQEDICI